MLSELETFNERFADEKDCFDLIYKVKWPTGYKCPRCGHPHAYTVATRRLPLYECMSCRHQSSLTAGTIFTKSRTSLRKWLLALYLVSSSEETQAGKENRACPLPSSSCCRSSIHNGPCQPRS